MGMKKSISTYLLAFVSAIFITSCATYHDLSSSYQQEIQQENYTNAFQKIEKNKFLKKKRNQLLAYLEKGKLAHLNKDYKLSNNYFNQADLLIEDAKKNIGNQVVGVLTNPEKETYRGEDFEKVAIHYYKALNYIFLQQLDDALVEAKRINLQLQKINDKYPEDKKNRYTSDAFALNLQGLLYEATGNLNDAFIAYRNAVDLYLQNQQVYFGVRIPKQLQQDLVNTAHLLGFRNEEERYAKQFGIAYDERYARNKNAIVFWENGLVPYKSQTYFTFTQLPGSSNGFVTITNKELGVNIPVPTQNTSSSASKFSDLSIINIAFPKYEDRPAYFTKAKLLHQAKDTTSIALELVQDYDVIAHQTLKDRTVREIGKMALRVATKKITEKIVSDQNANLGALVGLFNAITEKTDTRNWQTLPSKIYYARVPLHKDTQQLVLKASNTKGAQIEHVFKLKSHQKLSFFNFSTPQVIKYD